MWTRPCQRRSRWLLPAIYDSRPRRGRRDPANVLASHTAQRRSQRGRPVLPGPQDGVAPVLQEPDNAPAAVACLNEMVTDALKHVPHCLAYLERVHDWHIFRFCAIPQVGIHLVPVHLAIDLDMKVQPQHAPRPQIFNET